MKNINKNAKPVEKPNFNKQVDPNLTASVIFLRYIEAIGGKDVVNDIESIYMIAAAEFQGQKMDLETKLTTAGQSLTQVGLGGNVIQKEVLDGDEGFVVAQGRKIPYTEEQVVAAKAEAHPFPELKAENATVEGIEAVNGEDAYVVKMNETTNNYYSVETGLKLQQVKSVQQGPQRMTIPIQYSDYREVGGVKFPFKISQSMGPMTIDFEVTDIKLNEEVSDSNFM